MLRPALALEQWQKTVGESRPLGVTKHGTTTEMSSGTWTVPPTQQAGEARLPRIAKQSATTNPELAESSDEAGLCCSRANDNSAAVTAAVKSAGETRSSRIVKYSVTSKSSSELAEDLELVRVALQQRRGMWWEKCMGPGR